MGGEVGSGRWRAAEAPRGWDLLPALHWVETGMIVLVSIVFLFSYRDPQ